MKKIALLLASFALIFVCAAANTPIVGPTGDVIVTSPVSSHRVVERTVERDVYRPVYIIERNVCVYHYRPAYVYHYRPVYVYSGAVEKTVVEKTVVEKNVCVCRPLPRRIVRVPLLVVAPHRVIVEKKVEKHVEVKK